MLTCCYICNKGNIWISCNVCKCVCMCVYICMYICVYIYIYVYVCVFIWYMYVYMHMCIYICICVCVCIYIVQSVHWLSRRVTLNHRFEQFEQFELILRGPWVSAQYFMGISPIVVEIFQSELTGQTEQHYHPLTHTENVLSFTHLVQSSIFNLCLTFCLNYKTLQ